ncbi:DUF620 family protein [Trifolium medium]|uniref:DUF620 family protein n=1 Tax=Trifolium medium TaxID=97028 RepID=A0A392NQ15_9FABA|nr:DUF620 family protein [Trifolium medium]
MFGQRDSIGKYIVQQYVAATGGQGALNSLKNMYAMGEVRINGSDMRQSADDNSVSSRGKAEVGGFVLWQQNPDLWCLELVVSGFKITAGSAFTQLSISLTVESRLDNVEFKYEF